MKLTTKQDIETPIDFVFEQLTDFAQFERMAMRRGAEVERTDLLKKPGAGMAWQLSFTFRGKAREMQVHLTEAEPGSHLVYGLDGLTLHGTARIEVLSLSPKSTRMTVVSEVRPKTLGARVMLQSVRLARSRVQRKYDMAAADLGRMIEDRWQAARRKPF